MVLTEQVPVRGEALPFVHHFTEVCPSNICMKIDDTPHIAHCNIRRATSRYLLLVVFLAGIGTLGIEMVAARLLAPYFGNSQSIWAVVIGLTLIYLAAGYQLGGALADRRPDERLLYRIICWAGLLTGFIPLLSNPILRFSQHMSATFVGSNLLGALLGMLSLFAIPVTLMAMVNPFAIRLQLKGVDLGIAEAGATAGSLSALSTLGSIAGVFLPVIWLIPALGTARTIYLIAAFLIVVGLIGLRDWRYLAMALITVGLAWYTLRSGNTRASADCFGCRLAYVNVLDNNALPVTARDGLHDPGAIQDVREASGYPQGEGKGGLCRRLSDGTLMNGSPC